ncbi:MAG: calcium-binding protein [Rubrobacteraceae bacterium]
MKRTLMAAMVAALLAVFSAGTALAESDPRIYGTNNGDALYGTSGPDKIYGLGGADLIYGYAGRDVLYGGNEKGWGDKILGGSGPDKVRGQRGDDALYGQGGNDNVNGGAGGDLLVGGRGRDVLNGGPGFDRLNAQDGRRDIIIMCRNERDEVYYDRGLDVLRYCAGAARDTLRTSAEMVADTSSAADASNLSTRKPPGDLFENSREVLVKHEGSEQCVPEKELKNHVAHKDEIINATGCSTS